jgi:hypothetical protein
MLYSQLTLQFEETTRLKTLGIRATCAAIFSLDFSR